MKYSSKPFLLLCVVLMLAVGVWLLLGSRTLSSRADAGVAERIKGFRPVLLDDQEKYLSLLERNVMSGGPPKDGIPSIDQPKYTTAKEADEWLLPNDIVFGMQEGDFIAAYPQRILVWHEIVNERVAERLISITYCPLTGTAIGFYGDLPSDVSTQLGVSGKLVNSNLLMYDRASDSYWPQVLGKAIAGPAKGLALREFPLTWTTWERWKRKNSNTLVLSRSTGFFRDYERGGDPYGSYLDRSKGYYDSKKLLFIPVHQDRRLHPKTIVVGVRDAKGNALAVEKDALRERGMIEARLGSRAVVVRYDEELDSHRVEIKGAAEQLNAFDAMWFAWAAFYPGTQLVQ